MKTQIFKLSALFSLLLLLSCQDKDESKEMQAREEAKVGKIYDKKQQGIEHENRDNQFPVSRNDGRQGTGQETGAPSDTTRVKETTPQAPATPAQAN